MDDADVIENPSTPDEAEQDLAIEDIRVAKVQFNTKCFKLIYAFNRKLDSFIIHHS